MPAIVRPRSVAFKVVHSRKSAARYLAIDAFMLNNSYRAWSPGSASEFTRAAESLFGGTNGLAETQAARLGVA
jgi:hypothetical protein